MVAWFSRETWRGSERSVVTLGALFALCFGLIASMFFATNIADQNKLERREATTQQLGAISSQLSDKISGYEQMLLSGAALMQLNPETSREQWRTFTNSLRLQERYPSTIGFGYVEYFPQANILSHEEKVRGSGLSGYSVHPTLDEQPRENVSAITYLEPVNEINTKALGYDMFSETTRQAAMQKAIDTAAVTVAAPVDLVQFQDVLSAPKGILLYYPIYSSSSVPKDVQSRREQVRGFTYVVLLPRDILKEVAGESQIDFQHTYLSDISGQTPVSLLGELSTAKSETNQSNTQTMRIADRVWRAGLAQTPAPAFQKNMPIFAFIAGSIISAMSATLMFRMLNQRLKSINATYDQRLQETKDDMLALASHQLRTPASGVKQYVGMLTQGFVGQLNEQQQKIAEKAFAANERQLEIINQMLYVAKADAGQLLLEPTKIDLLELARNSVGIQRTVADNKHIRLVLDSKRKVHAYGDPRYIAMIIDNLISNAIKYTTAKKAITVRTYIAEGQACLSVSDEGVGIPKKDLGKVFEKFARIENPLTHSEGGNGLGLYLAYGLAHAHGGQLEVSSELHVGSTFTLSLPQKKPNKSKIRVRLDQMEKDLPHKQYK